ncbi:MAG: hypothetical protein AAFY81_04975 [Pseudomonadota bacterium]
MNTLKLAIEWRHTQSEYLDFIIDDKSLLEMFQRDYRGTLRGPFGFFGTSELKLLAEVALGQNAGELGNGRLVLYRCEDCGALGCGAITCRVTLEDESVYWTKFRLEADYEEFPVREHPEFIGLQFARDQYSQVFRNYLT